MHVKYKWYETVIYHEINQETNKVFLEQENGLFI